MIKRLYVNNYRSLVSFELFFDSANILCGLNGAGKSSVFDVIRFLTSFALGYCFFSSDPDESGRTINELEFTDWMNSKEQEFEIDIRFEGHDFNYMLHLEQVEGHAPRVAGETALCDGKELYKRDLSGVHFDNGRSGFPLDWHQAALASIQPVPERKEIEILRNALMQLLVLRPSVHSISAESKQEAIRLAVDMSNFTSWYRYLYQSQEYADLLRDMLKTVWEDLKFLELKNAGMSVKVLVLHFENTALPYNQLSDGEKMIVGLYAIQAALTLDKIKTVLIDEPDNYVGIQELQPWFLSISELANEEHQIIIISHNGEILNIGCSDMLFFSRRNHSSPTRVGKLKQIDGMLPGEILARGWGDLE